MSDVNGAVTLAQSYAPYGETLTSAGSGVSVWQYMGEARDVSGLTYLRARYLDSNVGRFTQRDPSGLEANLYLYAGANPIMNIDPSGNLYCRFGIDPETGLCKPPPDWLEDLSPFLSALFGEVIVKPSDAAKIIGICYFSYLITQIAPEIDTLPDIDLYEFFREQFGYWEYPTPEPEREPRFIPWPQPTSSNDTPKPEVTRTPEPEWHLYHYTSHEGLIGILEFEVIWATEDDPENWGDGQYFTDISPQEASIGSAHQLSRALFNTLWNHLRVERWIRINVADLPIKRVGAVFSHTYGNKSIYLHPSRNPLNVSGRIEDWGSTPFIK